MVHFLRFLMVKPTCSHRFDAIYVPRKLLTQPLDHLRTIDYMMSTPDAVDVDFVSGVVEGVVVDVDVHSLVVLGTFAAFVVRSETGIFNRVCDMSFTARSD